MVEQLKRKTIDVLFPRDTHPELPIDPDVVQPGQYKWPPHFTLGLQVVVFIGGCFGTLARYEIEDYLPDKPTTIPYGTLLVNLLGALLLGMLLQSLARHKVGRRSQLLRLGLGTGFMGAFTTYSTLAVEVSLLVRNGHSVTAAIYALFSVVGGIVCAATGIYLAAAYRRERNV